MATSVGPKKLKVNTEGKNSYLRLRKIEKSFEDVPLLDEESNDYNVKWLQLDSNPQPLSS